MAAEPVPDEHVDVDVDVDVDVVVVGAGPGGAATAYHLARRGRRVLLLDRRRFPRDKVCGDGLTRAALRHLEAMDLLSQLAPAQRVRGARVVMRGHPPRDLLYPPGTGPADAGLVVPRLELDDLLVRRAVQVGAELREGVTARRLIRDDGTIVGVEASRGAATFTVHASVVIAADGAASRLARQSGLVTTSPAGMGYAVRGYFDGISGVEDLLEIHIPLSDMTDRHVLPSYGWVFPLGEGRVNIGVGLFEQIERTNVGELYRRFLRELGERDLRFGELDPSSRMHGAPLRFDFAPDRCAAPGILLVGDAAGMVSPFTGEGISYALESGELAARCIDEELTRNPAKPVLGTDYGRRLGLRHTGYFETGRVSARRYRMVWHVIDATFDDDRPAFELVRRAALFPEGVGDSYLATLLDDVAPAVGDQAPRLRSDLLSVAEVLSETVRAEWPFLARLSTLDEGAAAPALRPAVFVLLASYLGSSARSRCVLAASAVELGYLAGLAIGGMAEDADAADPPPANWGNGFSIMAADFLLSCAHDLAARAGDAVAAAVAEALGRASRGRLRELRHVGSVDVALDEHLAVIDDKVANLFALPCRLGGMLSGLGTSDVTQLARYGHHLGRAHALTDEIAEVVSGTPWTRAAIGGHLHEGLLGLPALLAARESHTRIDWRELARDCAAGSDVADRLRTALNDHPTMTETGSLVANEVRLAQNALISLPDRPARWCLHRLAEHVLARASAQLQRSYS